MAYGRYLTPEEAKSGKYKGQIVVVPGSGIRFKSTALEPKVVGVNNPTPPVQVTPAPIDYNQQYLDQQAQFAGSAQGQQLAGAYSEPYLASTIDPYYNNQQGGEDYLKAGAQAQLGRNIDQTQQNYGQTFNDRGLYGSGVYQTELNKSLEGLNRGFNEQYGSGQYTPFSLRKQAIEQQRQSARIGATQQGQALYTGAETAYLNRINPVTGY
jgi:hypothetical protein